MFRLAPIKNFFIAYTLEDEMREAKVSGETRIKAGRYPIVINRAETKLTMKYRARYPWFQFHLMLKDVPGFTGIYIHSGKNDDFTDGCITVGDVVNNNNMGEGEITGSVSCFKRIYSSLYDHLDWKENGKYVNDAYITIRDEKHLI
jgi:hypothetical protein